MPHTRGREPELAAVEESFSALLRGSSAVLVFEGPPGIGKSRLLREVSVRAARSGIRTVAGTALEGQRACPFAMLLSALDEGEEPVVGERLARRLVATSGSAEWALQEVAAAIEAAAADGPLTVLIDDLQWAHSETLAGLRRLVDGLRRSPVLWMLAVTTGWAPPLVAETLAWLEATGARRVRLGKLPGPAVAQILFDVVGEPAGSVLLELTEQADGNPALVAALVRGLQEEQRLHTVDGQVLVCAGAPPRRVMQLIELRLNRLSAAAQRAVRVAAVLPRRFSVAHWAATLDQRPSELIEIIAEAFDADLLVEDDDQLRFRHGLFRQALVAATPRSLHRALQREVTGVLLATGAAPTEIALRMADSAEVGDREAVALVRQAADVIAASDSQSAAELSVRALRLLPPHDPARSSLVTDAVHLLHRAGRSDEARELGDSALAGALSAVPEAEVRLSLASMYTRPTGDRLRDNLLALELPALPPVLRARHQAWLAYNLAMSGRPEEAEKSAAEVRLCDDLQTRVLTELALTAADSAYGRITAALHRIEVVAEQVRGAPYADWQEIIPFHRAHLLAVSSRVADARSVLEGAVSRARHVSATVIVDAWAGFDGLLSLAAGRLCEVRDEFAPVHDTADTDEITGDYAAIARLSAWTSLYVHQGDAELARRVVAAARRVPGGAPPNVRRLARRVLAEREVRRGDPAKALRLISDDPLPATPPLLPHDFGYHVRVLRTALAARDPSAAERAAEAATLPYRESPGIRVFEGVAAHVQGLLTADPQVLADAARLLEGTERPLLFASAAEDVGRALGEHDERGAVAQLSAAFDTYLEHDAAADARRVGRVLAAKGAARRVVTRGRPDTGWESLTSAELKVVRLIAEGATNREAAARLILSPHTVSSHLRSAFTKLNINSRRELAKIVDALDA